MKRSINLATLFFLGVLPLGAIAADPVQAPAAKNEPAVPAAPSAKEEPAPLFKTLDGNHDGYVTKEEAKRSAEVTARFKELDTDRDGKIAAAEFTKGMQPKL